MRKLFKKKIWTMGSNPERIAVEEYNRRLDNWWRAVDTWYAE